MSDNIYYVYLHRKASDNEVFYVGKGSGKRAKNKNGRTLWWKNVVAKHGLIVEILESGLSEEDALDLEVETIKFYRENGHTLCNLNDGGGKGYKFSEELLLKIKATKSGEDYKRRMTLAVGRKVLCSNGMTFDSATSATKWLKQNYGKTGNVSACCNRKITHSAGYVWRWLADSADLQEVINNGLDAYVVFGGAKATTVQRRHKEIACSNGMTFAHAAVAVEWLRNTGFPRASATRIYECCWGNSNTAYGFKFWYTDDAKRASHYEDDEENYDKILDTCIQEVA